MSLVSPAALLCLGVVQNPSFIPYGQTTGNRAANRAEHRKRGAKERARVNGVIATSFVHRSTSLREGNDRANGAYGGSNGCTTLQLSHRCRLFMLSQLLFW